MTPLEQVRSLYGKLSMDDQVSILCDIIQRGQSGLEYSDDFVEALFDLDKAFDAAFADLKAAADGEGEAFDSSEAFWRESTYAIEAGLGQ